MEVLEIILNSVLLGSMSKSVGVDTPVQPAKVFTPRAITSGLKTSGVSEFGNLLKK